MKKKILLVEDDLFLAKVLKAKLMQLGHDVKDISDGAIAIKTIKAFKPDVVLLDVGLPHKNGFDILQEMKADKTMKKIPVLVLTKLGGESDRKYAMELGALRFLHKLDLSIDDLLKEFSYALKQ